MRKRDELSDPTSCLNKAREDEWLFVLLQRDPAAPDTVRDWAARRIRLGKNKPGDAQITEALRWADIVEMFVGPCRYTHCEHGVRGGERCGECERNEAVRRTELYEARHAKARHAPYSGPTCGHGVPHGVLCVHCTDGIEDCV